jgi:hypothetical protein
MIILRIQFKSGKILEALAPTASPEVFFAADTDHLVDYVMALNTHNQALSLWMLSDDSRFGDEEAHFIGSLFSVDLRARYRKSDSESQ